MLSLQIRNFSQKDLFKILEIENSSFQDPWPVSFFTYIHNKSPELFLIITKGKDICGYVIGEIREIMLSGLSHRSKVGHILNIAVDKNHRKKGIGKILITNIENKFKERSATQVTLEARESNKIARKFYLSQGYSEICKARAYYPDEDAIIMIKKL